MIIRIGTTGNISVVKPLEGELYAVLTAHEALVGGNARVDALDGIVRLLQEGKEETDETVPYTTTAWWISPKGFVHDVLLSCTAVSDALRIADHLAHCQAIHAWAVIRTRHRHVRERMRNWLLLQLP